MHDLLVTSFEIWPSWMARGVMEIHTWTASIADILHLLSHLFPPATPSLVCWSSLSAVFRQRQKMARSLPDWVKVCCTGVSSYFAKFVSFKLQNLTLTTVKI